MKAFRIGPDQIARIITGLLAEELAWRFKRYTDALTVASWSDATPLGPGGLALGPEERRACARRVAAHFGMPPSALAAAPGDTIAGWAVLVEAAVAAELVAFAFTPAGRDSETHACAHAADEIFKDAAAVANLFYGRRRVVSLVAPHSALGFELTTLLANLQQIPLFDARGLAPEPLAEALVFGDLVVATPTLWRYFVGHGVTAPDNAMAVAFGEPTTPELAADLRKAGFGALREVYGSTEHGLISWRDSPSEPFLIFDHWRRDGEDLLRLTPAGGERKVRPMDVLEWADDRSFRLGPRRDGAVQIGAVNVFPDEIAATIRRHEAVADCRIRVARRRGGENRISARIRLKPDAAPTEATARAVDAWCRAHLRAQERPRIYEFADDLDTE